MFFRSYQPPPDALAVASAAALLSVSEFRLFHMAYSAWYGREADEKTIETHFLPYMFRDVVPHWVRFFTRKVHHCVRRGQLDPRDFGVKPEKTLPADVIRGRVYLLGIGVTLTVLVILAELTARFLGLQNCLFPPCY